MPPPSLKRIDPDVIERVGVILNGRSPEAIQKSLGIGINTWGKLRRGEVIRKSVAVRLLGRVENLLNSAPQ